MKYATKQKAQTLIDKGATLIDMRDPISFRDGSVSGSKNLPYRNFVNSLLKFDKTKSMVVIVKDKNDTDLTSVDSFLNNLAFEKVWIIEYSKMIEK